MSDPCDVCGGVIKSSRIRAKGKLFHEECFVCSNCNTALESFFYKDGKLYCDPCEVALYAKKCDHCTLPIQSTIVNARSKIFHPECFICSTCNTIIKGGFFYIHGSFVCDSCDSQPKSASSTPSPTPTAVQPRPQTTPIPNISISASASPVTPPLSRTNTPPSPVIPLINGNSHPLVHNNNNNNRQSLDLQNGTGRNSIEVPGTNIVLSQLPPNTTIYVVNNSNPNLTHQISQLSLNGSEGILINPTTTTTSSPTTSANNSPALHRRQISTDSSVSRPVQQSSPTIQPIPMSPPEVQIEKFVPLINGKTLPELLRTQSFEDILTNVMRNKIRVHNEIKSTDITLGEVIASGASGKVHKGLYKGKDVAIKVYSADNICFSREEFDREVSIMSLVDHECFTEFYGANTEKSNYLFHVSELIKGGCLRDILLNKEISLTYAQQVSIALDVANGMEYLHSLGVIHRDLKSGNVLITDDMRGKVIDFGTSRSLDLSKQMTLNLGTSCWMAPEVFRNEPYTESCDVYSFGIVLWEIFCRRDPYDGVNSWSIPVMVCKGERPVVPADCPSEYAKLIKACWVDKAKKRPKFKEIRSTLNKIYGSLTVKSKRGSSLFEMLNYINDINKLPNEILEIILQDLLGESTGGANISLDSLKSFCSLRNVCQLWKELLESLILKITIGGCFRNRDYVNKQIESLSSILYNQKQSKCQLPRLQSIQLTFGLDSSSLQSLVNPLSHYYNYFDLSTINLSNNYLSYLSIKLLKPLITSSSSDNSHFNSTKSKPKLKLNLSGNTIGLAGVRYLSKYLSVRCNLVHLDLSNNELNNGGAKLLLMSMIYNTSIQSLNISGLKKINKLLVDTQQQRSIDGTSTNTDAYMTPVDITTTTTTTNLFPLENLILVGNDTGSGRLIIEQIQHNIYKHQLLRQQLAPMPIPLFTINNSNHHCKV
ncbi:LIM-type zinc finger-containing protein [Heterostelium album PN500]|uniref:LIM-type zinc finger-containing protein n=1 Tax=Heterostelium pallidum (strain ATCC 26659 / Pp 5 / PN500) TaxID=670386 RepID=D3BG92_HETP5|nr:LIM-type zinc finger-containing protein [Heterostelium album PN500]EFA79492.1 LIM-type zinc finger-containing protein [Heterostelium album PN500]|eukprot:XP_020431613.1 LIM-type zinc finger-containing protein [Heterostelium album PN500]